MAKVNNLRVNQQSGSDNLYATWGFDATVKTTSGVSAGDWVTVNAGSKWYNGASIASFVFGQEWQVLQIYGDRAVLNANRSGSNHIMSPIHVSNITSSSGGSGAVTEDTIDHYEVRWEYDTGNGVWFSGGSSNVGANYKNATYSPPDNALTVRVYVKPVSKTHKVNNEDVSYWTGEETSADFSMVWYRPEDVSVPTVAVKGYDVTLTIDNINDPRCSHVDFEIRRTTVSNTAGGGDQDNWAKDELFTTITGIVQNARALVKVTLSAGGKYRARARGVNSVIGSNGSIQAKINGDWSNYSSEFVTVPDPPSGITLIRANSTTSVYLEWGAVSSADTYEIEYADNVTYFDNAQDTSKVSSIKYNHYEITGLETGHEYFFRVRAVNGQGESAWTGIKSCTIGKKPSMPTTWSSTTTAIVGEMVYLYWVHNAQDGSSEYVADLELTIDGRTSIKTIKNTTDEDEKDKTKVYELDTSKYKEGTKIEWRVRTSGVTHEYGDWSVKRKVDVYAKPILSVSVINQNGSPTDTILNFPFKIKAVAGPNTQAPIGYHVTISPNVGYTSVDNIGNEYLVSPGEVIFTKYYDTDQVLNAEMTPAVIDLQDSVEYTVSVVVSMNSGLTASSEAVFTVHWADIGYRLDCEMTIDTDTYTAYVTPWCVNPSDNTIPDVTMSVYRREYDGTYQEIMTGLDPRQSVSVTDPHPALDYARYRLVAISNETGAVSYYDPPGYPIHCPYAIVQWNENWINFDTSNTAVRAEPAWTGSMLKLMYNLDVSDSGDVDSEQVEYIGRKFPVSYYGTMINETSSWSLVIDKEDKETLYALRRLKKYAGDCYVREPSGSGYWAKLSVSINQTHNEPAASVTIDITRVDGGV